MFCVYSNKELRKVHQEIRKRIDKLENTMNKRDDSAQKLKRSSIIYEEPRSSVWLTRQAECLAFVGRWISVSFTFPCEPYANPIVYVRQALCLTAKDPRRFMRNRGCLKKQAFIKETICLSLLAFSSFLSTLSSLRSTNERVLHFMECIR